jgi:hypothetical protein
VRGGVAALRRWRTLPPPLALAIAVLGGPWRDLVPAVRHAGPRATCARR